MTRLLWTASRSLNNKQLVRLEQAGYQVDWLPVIQLEPLSQVNPLKLQQGDAFFFVSRMAGQAVFNSTFFLVASKLDAILARTTPLIAKP